MKRFILLLIVFTFLIGILNAQYKSTGKALILSAILPGAGQLYLGQDTRAGVFAGTELLILLSYIRLNQEVDWKINSYKLYANRYADIPLNSSENYYKIVGTYVNSDIYNEEVEMYYRNRYIVYQYSPEDYQRYLDMYLIQGEDEWKWASEKSWLEYRDIRSDKQQMEIFANFAFGAAILNRLISVIDTAIIARSLKQSKDLTNKTSMISNLTVEPDYNRNGFLFHYQYRF